MIALLLLARELLGHRLGRKLRGPGTLSPDPRERSSCLPDLNPRTPGRELGGRPLLATPQPLHAAAQQR